MDFWFDATKGPMSMNLWEKEKERRKDLSQLVSTRGGREEEEEEERKEGEKRDALESGNGLEVIQLENDGLRSVGVRDVVPAGIRDAGEVGELGSEGVDVALQIERRKRSSDFSFVRLPSRELRTYPEVLERQIRDLGRLVLGIGRRSELLVVVRL